MNQSTYGIKRKGTHYPPLSQEKEPTTMRCIIQTDINKIEDKNQGYFIRLQHFRKFKKKKIIFKI